MTILGTSISIIANKINSTWNISYVKKTAALDLLPFRSSPRNSCLGYEK